MGDENKTNEKSTGGSKVILVLRWIIFLACLLVFSSYVIRQFSKAYFTRHIAIAVTDKAVKNNKYMVYGRTVDPEHLPKSYEITDSALANRYDSSDLYAEIDVGKTYEFIVGGNRIPFMSWYPDIFSVTEIKVLESETEYEEGVNNE
jgi:hypothetical protein